MGTGGDGTRSGDPLTPAFSRAAHKARAEHPPPHPHPERPQRGAGTVRPRQVQCAGSVQQLPKSPPLNAGQSRVQLSCAGDQTPLSTPGLPTTTERAQGARPRRQ